MLRFFFALYLLGCCSTLTLKAQPQKAFFSFYVRAYDQNGRTIGPHNIKIENGLCYSPGTDSSCTFCVMNKSYKLLSEDGEGYYDNAELKIMQGTEVLNVSIKKARPNTIYVLENIPFDPQAVKITIPNDIRKTAKPVKTTGTNCADRNAISLQELFDKGYKKR